MAATRALTHTHTKPAMNWNALTEPLETTGHRVRRIIGQCFLLIGCPAAAGATYYVYHYMTSTPERIFAAYDATRFLTVATAVGGAALWYFNRSVDSTALQQKRRDLEATLEKTPLATIRRENLTAVISDRELNAWMRYILKEESYDQFICSQTDSIFDIALEEASIHLLREKYLAFLNAPCSIGLATLAGQRAFKTLLSETEQKSMRKLYAEKEAKSALTYKEFIDRNGVEALADIEDPAAKGSLFSKFLTHVREKNLGLIQTRQQFAHDMRGFGVDQQPVVDDEIRKLESFTGKTYKEFRLRNGFDEIKLRSVGDPELIKQKFLQLAYADQVSPAYEEDRGLLNITLDDIKKEMKSRWLSTPLSKILKTERDDFLACMTAAVLAPREWTAKAVLETRGLLIQDIVRDYADLFAAGVLTAKDGNLTARLEHESKGQDLVSMISTYGDVIFKYGLIDDNAIQRVVKGFVIAHACFYLGIDTDPNVSTNIERISSLGLVSDLLRPIGEGQRVVGEAKQHHLQRVNDIHDRFKRHAGEITDDLTILTKTERNSVESAQKEFNQAESEVRERAEQVNSLKQAAAQYLSQRDTTEAEKDRQQKRLQRLHAEQARLQLQPVIDLFAYQQELLRENVYYAAIDAKIKDDPFVLQLKQAIAAFPQVELLEKQISEYQGLQKALTELKKEVESSPFKARKEELENSMNTPIPASVQGVEAAQKAQDLKKAVEKNRAELEQMNAQKKRLDELIAQLQDIDTDALSSRVQALRTQISQHQATLTQRIAKMEADAELTAHRARVQALSGAIQSYKRNQEALVQNAQEIERVNTDINKLKSLSRDAEMHRDIKIAELHIAERNSGAATSVKAAAERALAAAHHILNTKKNQVAAELEEKKRHWSTEKARALQEENTSYQALLAQLTQDFIRAVNSNN